MRAPRGAKSVTIVDIADRLGLSPMTVSRALNGTPPGASAATRARVLACAADLGYQPNRWARSLVQRRSSIVGIVIPDIAHTFFAQITTGIEEVLEKSGYDILLCHSRNDPAREKSEIAMLTGSRVDGLIVASCQPPLSPDLFLDIRRRKIPFVLIDRFFPKRSFAGVRTDDREVGRVATAYLVSLGHSRIAFIGGPDLSPALLRRRGFSDALGSAGLRSRSAWIVAGDFEIEGGYSAMQQLLAARTRPTAVFAANDPMAIGAIYAARDAGLRVPQDISVIGAGNIEGRHHPNPYLTTVDWPREDLGRSAAHILLEAIRLPTRRTLTAFEIFPPRLLVRQTTAPPA